MAAQIQPEIEKEHLAINKFLGDVYKRSDTIIGIFLLSYFAFGLLLAFWYGTWTIAIVVGGLSTGSFFLAGKLFPGTTVNQYVASTAIGIYVAQFIYQMHGMFEMHFFAFIGATLMITYQNWKALIPIGLVVAVHHGLFAYLEYAGNDQIYFTTDAYDMDLQAFIFHVALAVVVLGICGLWSYQLEQTTIRNTKNILVVEEMTENMASDLELAINMSNGNLDSTFSPKEGDMLGQVLLEIREKLKAKQV
jgi:hypothetical protein